MSNKIKHIAKQLPSKPTEKETRKLMAKLLPLWKPRGASQTPSEVK